LHGYAHSAEKLVGQFGRYGAVLPDRRGIFPLLLTQVTHLMGFIARVDLLCGACGLALVLASRNPCPTYLLIATRRIMGIRGAEF
jgi:hypothetical protein